MLRAVLENKENLRSKNPLHFKPDQPSTGKKTVDCLFFQTSRENRRLFREFRGSQGLE
jgi:hypothetical protein